MITSEFVYIFCNSTNEFLYVCSVNIKFLVSKSIVFVIPNINDYI